MRPLTLKTPGVVVALYCEPEEIPIEGNALASGDDADDAKENARIRAALDAGNEWAWCCAHVRVTYDVPIPGMTFPAHVEGNAYLGACSYDSEEDFRRDCYPDMLEEALADLNTRRAALCTD